MPVTVVTGPVMDQVRKACFVEIKAGARILYVKANAINFK